jgi:diaminopimelate decarboxylase
MKANSNRDVLKTVRRAGSGIDVVSGGELQIALEAGFRPNQIIYSGVGKTESEIRLALRKRIKLINVESVPELQLIAKIAKSMRVTAEVGFRFNPDVDARTHPYITTGFRENKFGLDKRALAEYIASFQKNRKWLVQKGLSLHIGSQLSDVSAIKDAIRKAKTVYLDFLKHGHPMGYFDVGGGVGIDYHDGSPRPPTFEKYAETVLAALGDLKTTVLCEPGRALVGPAGVLVTKVLFVKTTRYKTFVIVDTGMHHLIRPALYGAYHRILPAKKTVRKEMVCDVVGPICESGDFLARNRKIPSVNQGEFLVIGEAGAYGYSMASHYNSHKLPLEIV